MNQHLEHLAASPPKQSLQSYATAQQRLRIHVGAYRRARSTRLRSSSAGPVLGLRAK